MCTYGTARRLSFRYYVTYARKLKKESINHCMMVSNSDLSVLSLYQVAIELVKVVKKSPAEDFKNCFMNLALPYVIFSEPGPPEVTVIR